MAREVRRGVTLAESVRLKGMRFTVMDPNRSALERAFQLARSGRLATVDDIKKQLKQEGYDVSSAYSGPSLRSQLRDLIEAAHLEPGVPRKH